VRAAWLILGGHRIPVDGDVTIGRAPQSTLTIDDPEVSRSHARVYREGSTYKVEDLGSANGTFLNDHRIAGPAMLSDGDRVRVAGVGVEFTQAGAAPPRDATRVVSRALPTVAVERVKLGEGRFTIGRDTDNDLVLDHPNVSGVHAVLMREGGQVRLIDRASTNGTRVNGRPITQRAVQPGDQIGIGPFVIVVDETDVVARSEQGALWLQADAVEVRVGDKQVLKPTTLSVEPGELVVVIGESGAGKSTLIKAIAGVNTISGGSITVNGEPLAARLPDIGYVPQDEIVHGLLTVREALVFAARLRLPDGAGDADVEEAVQRVLGELALVEHADTRVAALSGGQRKRVGVGVELVSRPSLLFLDEPTSGLDPGLETRMMELLRALADNSRAVAVVTHATTNLGLCDKLVVMGRGGVLTFQGSPDEALRFFGVGEYDGIYAALDATPAKEWAERFGAQAAGAPQQAARPEPAIRKRRGLLRQTALLTRRYARLMARDRLNLAILLGQVPVLALAEVGLFQMGLFERPDGRPGDAVALIFLLIINTIWLGSLDGARELVRERSVYQREAAVGVRLSAYLLSKVGPLFALSVVQTVALTAIVLVFHPLELSTSGYVAVFAILGLTGLVAVAMGLLISAAAGTEDQAISITPLAVLPQILYAGSLVPIERMAEPVATIADAIFGRWALAAVGNTLDMNARFAENAEFAAVNRFGDDFFSLSEPTGAAILAGFLVGFLAITVLLLRRQAGPVKH
jgi:ABC-type multidrug transport system ATPase subunit/pSer/pThr/pTyr-binding forkhead associated (FHA) protein